MRFKAPYISFRNGHPHFMIRVPIDLVDKFNSQYIRKALKTSHPTDAKLLASTMALKAKSSFTLLRSGVLSGDQEQAIISTYALKRNTLIKAKSVSLNDLYKLYYAEKSPNWSKRTPGEINAQFEGVVKVIGNLPADNLDRSVLIAGREKLLERLSVRTVNKYLTLLSSVLLWGVKHGYISKNPAEGLQLELKKRADEERKIIVGKLLADRDHYNEYTTTAFVWNNSSMTTLQGTTNGMTSAAYGINNSNQIVGGPVLNVRSGVALGWNNNKMTSLNTASGFNGSSYTDANSEARAINNIGQAVGKTWLTNGYEATLWSNGSMQRLGTLSSQTSRSYANSINDKGQVVGSSEIGNGAYIKHAFIWENGTMVDLGTQGASSSEAYDINQLGQVVGTSYNDEYAAGQLNKHAVLWDNGTAISLNSLVAGTGWTLTDAVAMNDSGQIIGNGELNGIQRSFLMTPDSVTPIVVAAIC